jgi:hypothetical protein
VATVQFVGEVSFSVTETLTTQQVEMSTKKTIAKKLDIAHTSVSATATKTSSRRLVADELLRQLAGANTWKVDWTATVPKATEATVATKVTNLTDDKASIAAGLKAELAIMGVSISSLNVTKAFGNKKTDTESSRAPGLSGKLAVGTAFLMSTLVSLAGALPVGWLD